MFFWQIAFNALAIFFADKLLANISLNGQWWWYLIAGLILGIINAIIKPILKLVILPLRMLTLGMFNIVINIVLLWLLVQFVPELQISGFYAYLWGSVIIGIVNTFFVAGKKAVESAD